MKLSFSQLFGLLLLCLHLAITMAYSKENFTDAKADALKAIAKNDFRLFRLASYGPGYKAGVACRQDIHLESKLIRYNFLTGPNYASIRNQNDRNLIEYSAKYNKIILMDKNYPDPDLCAPIKVCYKKFDKRETATNCEITKVRYRTPPGPATTLHMAVRQKDLTKVKDILGVGFWNSLKFWRISSENTELLENKLDKKRRTALHYAAENGSFEIVELLIENGAEIQPVYKLPETRHFSKAENYQSKKNGMGLQQHSPLYYAVHANNLKVSEYLISKGSIWYDSTQNMEMAAAFNNNLELIKLLISAKESDEKAILGNSLIAAVMRENFPLVKQLISMGANTNYYYNVSFAGIKSFVLSAALLQTDHHNGHDNKKGLEIFQYLLTNGGDPNLPIDTYEGEISSLVCDAINAELRDGLVLLLNHGASPLPPCMENILTVAGDPQHLNKKDHLFYIDRFSNPDIRKALIDAGMPEARLPSISMGAK